MQEVGSFKIRGAYNKISSLNNNERNKGVVCSSAGNHAQGVAKSCNLLKIEGVIFMPTITPRQKIEQVVTKNTKPLYEKGYYEYFLDDKGSGSVEVYKIIEKGKSLKVKLSLTDKALLRGDL